MNSMTGFGRSQKTTPAGTVEAQLSTYNKRGLEISIQLPREMNFMEGELTEELKSAFERGKVQLNIRAQVAEQKSLRNLDGNLKKLKAACAQSGTVFSLDATLVWELLRTDSDTPTETSALTPLVMKAAEQAILLCQKAQAQEGKRLQADFEKRLRIIAELHKKAQNLARESLELQRTRLEKNLALAGLAVDMNDERILKELALFADRADIAEELTRIGSHLVSARKLIASPGSIGRQLEFLLQEFLREWNTLGNKSAQVELVQLALAAKNEIERLREQAANIA